jgi:hypothetical protein
MVKKTERDYSTIRFILAIMFPLLNLLSNSVASNTIASSLRFLPINNVLALETLSGIFITLFFIFILLSFVLTEKRQKNRRKLFESFDEKPKRGLIIIYLFVISFCALPNWVFHASGDIPIFFIPFFTAYIVYLANNLDELKL